MDKILYQAWEQGIILAGLSAGSICWFEEGITDANPNRDLTSIQGLGFLKGSHCPHYDGEIERRPTYHRLIQNGMKPGFACDDGAAIHWVDNIIAEAVCSRPNARVYYVKYENGEIIEEK